MYDYGRTRYNCVQSVVFVIFTTQKGCGLFTSQNKFIHDL